jgi:Type IV leader peptidase family
VSPAHAGLAGACAAVIAVPMTGAAFAVPVEGNARLSAGWWYARSARRWTVLAMVAVTAAAVFAIARRLPATPEAVAYLATATGGVGLAVIDLRVRRLPFPLTGVLYAVCALSLTANQLLHQQRPGESLPRAAGTAALVTTAFLVLALVFAGQLGLGDVVLVGLLTGLLAYRNWPAVVLGLAVGLLLQLPAALLAMARGQRGAAFPLGASLIAGWLIVIATTS